MDGEVRTVRLRGSGIKARVRIVPENQIAFLSEHLTSHTKNGQMGLAIYYFCENYLEEVIPAIIGKDKKFRESVFNELYEAICYYNPAVNKPPVAEKIPQLPAVIDVRVENRQRKRKKTVQKETRVDVFTKERVRGLSKHLDSVVFGQHEVTETIQHYFEMAISGLKDPNRPRGVFLFAGESGTGKTMTVKELAKYFFGKDWKNGLFTINGSEFQQEHETAKLLGCFVEGSLVTMGDGTQKEIQNIEVGEEVVTHLGKVRPVIDRYNYEAPPRMLKVSLAGIPQPIICTHEHEIYSIVLEKGASFSVSHMNRLSAGACEQENLAWNTASSLAVRDWVAIPRPNFIESDSCYDLADCIPIIGGETRYRYDTGDQLMRFNAEVKETSQTVMSDFPNRETRNMRSDDSYIYHRVEAVEEVAYEGEFVYDLSVGEDTSYCVNGVAVHNSPAGYVGYDDGAAFLKHMAKYPDSIILVDEFEKAHPRFQDVFLQIMDEAACYDNRGNPVDFSQTFIVFTSNIGTREVYHQNHLGFGDRVKNEDAPIYVDSALSKFCRVEFLKRFDGTVIFNLLDREHFISIAKAEVQSITDRLRDKSLKLRVSAKVYGVLVDEMQPGDSARDLNTVVRKHISAPISALLCGEEDYNEFRVTAGDGVIEVRGVAVGEEE